MIETISEVNGSCPRLSAKKSEYSVVLLIEEEEGDSQSDSHDAYSNSQVDDGCGVRYLLAAAFLIEG